MEVMLWGAGGNAKIYLKMLEENYKNDFQVTGIFENKLKSLPFNTKLPICRSKKELSLLINKSTHFVISIGYNGLARYEISQQLKKKGLKFVKCKCKSEHIYINPWINESYLLNHFKNSKSWKIWSNEVLKSEENYKDYIFVDEKSFKTMIKEDRFLEHAEVFGNKYGTLKKPIIEIRVKT